MYRVKGTVYGDMAQLECGTTANRCNLIDNGDFTLGVHRVLPAREPRLQMN